MVKPVHFFINGTELLAWTEASLSRSKDNLTGQLNISIFMGRIPDAPTLVDACHGREITMYVGGHLAFIGTIDKRIGTGRRHGRDGTTVNDDNQGETDGVAQRSVNIGPNEYTVQLSCRGRLKVLIDSSHQHPTTNMLKPKDRQVVEKLVEPWNIELEWLGQEIELDKVRLRDGAVVIDELNRIMREQCHFMYETRDGKLRVTDDIGPTVGEPLILGTNILSFSAEQSESEAKGKIRVKGQRIKADVWGEDAVLPPVIEIQDQWLQTDLRTTVQHYGDGTPEALERRARFEMNKRSSASKKVTVEVFHVQSTNGEPWDVGQLHYVEVPPEGIFDMFECTELNYQIQNDQTLKTTLTLAPPPASGPAGGTGAFLSNLPAIASDFASIGNQRRTSAGVTFATGLYPQPWSGPVLSVIASTVSLAATAVAGLFGSLEEDTDKPPKKLPDSYESKTPIGGRNR